MNAWELRGATYRINGRALVEGASVAVRPGRVVAALGPNGAGKSTLLRMAAGLLPTTEGEVLLDGRSLSVYARREAARRIAFMPQDTHVEFDFNAFEIAAMGRNPHLGRFQSFSSEDRRIVEEAMKRTETLEFAARAITTLSGGERQRVFLARALATESPYIALDEPTANLDIEHTLGLFSLARNLADKERRGVLVAVHDLNLAVGFCDEAALLLRGRVVASGETAAVLTPERIREAFHVEAEALQARDGAKVFSFRMG